MADFRYIKRGAEPDGKYHLTGEEMSRRMKDAPWEMAAEPFRGAPHCWFVSGITDVGSWLIDTGDGLIIIDVPAFNSLYLQLEAIRKAGYDPHDIKYIWNTHPHADHYGGLRALKEYTGAKVWMSHDGWEYYQKRDKNRRDAFDVGHAFEPDMFYEDNNPFTMGRMTFTFKICPGHCPGSCVYFFEDTDEETGKTYKVAMHGGIGETSTERILRSGAPLWHYYRFLADCLEMSEWPVDIVLASHENQFNLFSGVNYDNPRDYSEFTHGDLWKMLLLSKYEDAKRMG